MPASHKEKARMRCTRAFYWEKGESFPVAELNA